ncbi:MAG TPA: hypothetical protein VD931_05795 [Baekduia sp.]|nr:hypothetical protein [Baekduia sp.]
MTTSLTIPGLEGDRARARRRPAAPAGSAAEPGLLARLVGERAGEQPPPATVPGPSGPTLDDMLTGAWAELTASRPAACPVCREPMRPAGTPATPAGHCRSCGSTLS